MTLTWAMLVSLIISLASGPVLIPVLRRLKFGQYIRLEGPQKHMVKAGTPTMGGLMFLLSTTTATLLFFRGSKEALLALGITLAFGFLGFLDDFIKVVLKRPLGLKAREKLAGQFLLAFFLGYFALQFGRGTDILVPFTDYRLVLPLWLFLFFDTLLVVGFANAVNLTDGLDGLAAGTTVVSSTVFVLILLLTDKIETMGSLGLAVFAGALAAGLLGFLFFNRHPARVFMGDTGSLALGGALSAIAVISKTELFLLIVGAVYVIETFSVIIQVISFKMTGKRVFLMSPLHHHYELKGWPEKKVVRFFWLWSLIFGALGLLGLAKML